MTKQTDPSHDRPIGKHQDSSKKNESRPPPTKRSAPVKLITDAAVLKLLTAFADIRDRAIRGCLSELVELVAKSAKEKGRR